MAAAANRSVVSLRPWLAQHCTWPANNFHFGRLQPSKSVEFQRAFRPCCADHVEDALPELPLPLCERHGRHEVPLASLLQWRATALQRASEVGESWTQQDDGPSQEDLVTELSWLLDDAVAEEATGGVGAGAGVSWRQLERELRMDSDRGVEGRLVVLREGLEYLEDIWRRRVQDRVPLQYLTSTVFWRDLVLCVGPGVLIPRPETELVIDFAVEAVAAQPELGRGQWADLGTGSGALALGLARALPTAPVIWAVDLDAAPATYAAANAQRLGLASRVRVVRGSWFEPLLAAAVSQLAGIVSNPPYIVTEEMPGLQAEVGQHEPRLALDGGEGLGIDALMPICLGAAKMLQPGGFLALETGGGQQGQYVADVLRRMRCPLLGEGEGWEGGADGEAMAFENVLVRADLRGVDRFVTATRSGRT